MYKKHVFVNFEMLNYFFWASKTVSLNISLFKNIFHKEKMKMNATKKINETMF